jgi:hypothetical protein
MKSRLRPRKTYIRRRSEKLDHSDFRIQPDTMSRCKLELGNGRYVEVKEWKDELRVDLREWKEGIPTKKGMSMTLMRWKNWIDYIEYLNEAWMDKKAYSSHLGGNVYCTIAEGSKCVDLRQYWKPEETVVPSKKGLCLRPGEYNALKELIPEINKTLPELDAVVPCYLQSDHMNQKGALQCPECNPNDFMNW